MMENKKKILAAAAFLIAAGLVFGMSKRGAGWRLPERERNGIETIDSRGQNPLEMEDGVAANQKEKPETDVGESEVSRRSEHSQAVGTDPGKSPEKQEETVENSSETGVFVYICGEVMSPGVYELSENSRIYEAVDAAGGFTEDAAREAINLASKVSDGMQIIIYSKKEAETLSAQPAQMAGTGGSMTSGKSSGLVNLNTATKEELMILKGIGEAKAEDIIRYREKNGGFQKIEDIMKISGIKEAGFQKIKDSITVTR